MKRMPTNKGDTTLTNASSNKDGNLSVEHILCRGTKRSIDPDTGKGDCGILKLDEITTSSESKLFLVFLGALHGCLSHCSDDGWPGTKTFAEGPSEVTHLTDVDGNIGIFGCGGDGKLRKGRFLSTRKIQVGKEHVRDATASERFREPG